MAEEKWYPGKFIEKATKGSILKQEGRLIFWLEQLIRDVDVAMRDEEEAWRMYDKLRTDIAAVYPPGTLAYDTVVKIIADEKRHYEELSRIKRTLLQRLEAEG